MAFQTGTQVRPELGRADVSGFAKGGAAIGAGILQGIENYREQKQITASALADLEGRFAADPSLLATASQAGGNIGKSFKKVFEEGDFNQRDVLNLSGYVNSLQSTQAAAQQSRLREAQIAEAVTPKTPAGKPVTGRKVTMEELNQLRDEGYKPTVKFDSEGEMIMTDLGTFAQRDTGPEPLTVGQEKMLEETAKDLAPWGTGGKQQAEANLATYDNLITGLTSGEITTRGFADLTPQALGVDDTLRQLLNPTGQNAVDNVRRVIFQGLKDTLGAQFTQREAERLVAASYNPALPEEMNIARLQDARDVLADVIAAKNDLYAHISAGGTMGDYKGVAPAAVLSSGIKATQDKYDADPEKGGFQAPSGITIRVKSKRPIK